MFLIALSDWFIFHESCVLFILLIMNLLSSNCRGAINPNFGIVVSDMIRRYHLAILIISETKVSGDRAKDIIDRIPMDGAIATNSIGLSRGLWMLWDLS